MNWEDACRILGVETTASDAEIRARYLYKANILHPDRTRHLPDRMRTEAEQEFKLVNQAHDVLKDPRNNPYSTPPKLEITPKHIRFKDVEIGQKKKTTFEIRSVGGPYTNIWIDNEPAPWLSVVAVRSLADEQLPLEVTIETTGIGEPDTQYSCNLLVKLENEKTKLKAEEKLKIELRMKPEPAILLADKSVIEIKPIRLGDMPAKTFTVRNAGRGWLRGNISTSKPWLSVEPNTIDIAPSARQLYTVKVETSSLPYGFEDKESIYLNSNAGNYAIAIDIDYYYVEAVPVTARAEQTPTDFSSSEFWSTIGKFILYPIGLFFVTIPLLTYLYEQEILGPIVGAYVAVAFLVAIIRGHRQGKNKSLIYKQQQKTVTSTSSRDIFAPSTLASRTNFVIANTSNGVYHKPSCEWAKRISSSNVVKVTTEEATRRSYKRCRFCRP